MLQVKRENKDVFLTFDMDWADDGVLKYFHSLICELGIYGTLHVTHQTPALAEIRKEGRLELGIHPNFNKLLDNTECRGTDFRQKVRELLEIVPEAVCVRSHSLVSGSPVSRCFAENKLKYESNLLYFPGGG